MPKVNIQIMNGLYLWRFSIMIHAQIVAHFVGYHIHYIKGHPHIKYALMGEGGGQKMPKVAFIRAVLL